MRGSRESVGIGKATCPLNLLRTPIFLIGCAGIVGANLTQSNAGTTKDLSPLAGSGRFSHP
jgi:hypothetical protein